MLCTQTHASFPYASVLSFIGYMDEGCALTKNTQFTIPSIEACVFALDFQLNDSRKVVDVSLRNSSTMNERYE